MQLGAAAGAFDIFRLQPSRLKKHKQLGKPNYSGKRKKCAGIHVCLSPELILLRINATTTSIALFS